MFLRSNTKDGIFLDAGEGTLGQLRRKEGLEKAIKTIEQAKIIWISHLHADHHLGTIRILLERQKLGTTKTFVVGPTLLNLWLGEYSRLESLEYEFIDNLQLIKEPAQVLSFHLLTVPVIHCVDAYGLVLTCGNKKIV